MPMRRLARPGRVEAAAALADVVLGQRRSTVVDGRRLEDDAESAHRTRRGEQPQEQPVVSRPPGGR